MQLALQLDLPPPPVPVLASSEKGKARDIIQAIRTLKQIDQEKRPATLEERHILARFGGFGAVALSIFPDPSPVGTRTAGSLSARS